VLSGARHDLYHLPGFIDLATRWHEAGTPTAFVATEGDHLFLVPLISRPIPESLADGEDLLDAAGPRGYPGPIVGPAPTGVHDGAFVRRAMEAFVEMLREERIVTAFVRCHPLLSPHLDILRSVGDVVVHGESVSIDLARPEAETWSAIRENHRRAITRANRDGYRMRIDESWSRLEEFVATYRAAMDRLGAAEHWKLPRDYFFDLQAAVGPRIHLCVVEKEGELAAAALLSEVDGIVEYHLSGTALGHVAASPTKLLIEQASRWARDRGNRVFHLAGSLRNDDALIHFKRGFSPLRHPVASWRVVADPSAHARLVERWRRSTEVPGTPGEDGNADFFPAYRRPTTFLPGAADGGT